LPRKSAAFKLIAQHQRKHKPFFQSSSGAEEKKRTQGSKSQAGSMLWRANQAWQFASTISRAGSTPGVRTQPARHQGQSPTPIKWLVSRPVVVTQPPNKKLLTKRTQQKAAKGIQKAGLAPRSSANTASLKDPKGLTWVWCAKQAAQQQGLNHHLGKARG